MLSLKGKAINHNFVLLLLSKKISIAKLLHTHTLTHIVSLSSKKKVLQKEFRQSLLQIFGAIKEGLQISILFFGVSVNQGREGILMHTMVLSCKESL